MSFVSVAAGQPIRSTHVQQFTSWLTAQKLDTPGTIACTSASEYTLTVRSQETTTGMALAVQYGSSGAPTTLAYFTKAASRISSNDGSQYLQVTNTGVGVTGTFAASTTALFGDGTIATPSMAFAADTNTGRYRAGADEMADVVGGGVTGGGAAIRYRKGSRFPQIGIGHLDGGSWSWTGSTGTLMHVHQVVDGASDGDLIGLAVEIRSDASSGGAGAVPDSSAISAYAYQSAGSPNGAIRAGEFQVIRDVDSCSNDNSTAFGLEVGLHLSAVGNTSLYNKTGGINLISTEAGLTGAAEKADTGIYIHGDAGYHRPIYYRNELTGAGTNDAFFINTQGLEYVGDPDTGEFRAAANTLAWSVGGTEQMRVDSNGLGIKRSPAASTALAVQGNCYFASGNGSTNQQFQFGRTAVDAQFVIAGSAGQYANEATAGSFVLRAESGNALLLANGADGVSVVRIGASRIGFYGTAPVTRPSAYTQTYSTASRTHAAFTSSTLTVSVGSGSTTVSDVGAAFNQTTLNDIVRSLADQINYLRVDLANTRSVLNQVIDDGQAFGLLA